ncbi:MAG: signal peptidase I [Lachnospiraceae bacterium]|jgi:signal peptidase I|nr:signal peptidase I [Lachnospiraceae bacterium]
MAIRRKSHDYRGGRLHVEPQRKKVNFGRLYEVLTWVFGVLLSAFLGAFLVYAFGIRTSVIGPSMEPVLSAGQGILLDRIIYQFSSPDRGDVVVFHPNGNENTHLYVKRVIALPGETVQIKQGRLYINGVQFAQDYSRELMEPGIAENAITLGVEDYFVLGDNRAESEDSRSADIGVVTRSMIEGKAWLHLERDEEEGIGRIK